MLMAKVGTPPVGPHAATLKPASLRCGSTRDVNESGAKKECEQLRPPSRRWIPSDRQALHLSDWNNWIPWWETEGWRNESTHLHRSTGGTAYGR